MTDSVPTVAHLPAREILRRSPTSWKVAAIVAGCGWLFHAGVSETMTVNGLQSCTGLDVGPFIVGGVVALATVDGVQRVRRAHRNWRLPTPTAAIIAGSLLAAAAFYVLRGVLEPAGNLC